MQMQKKHYQQASANEFVGNVIIPTRLLQKSGVFRVKKALPLAISTEKERLPLSETFGRGFWRQRRTGRRVLLAACPVHRHTATLILAH